MKYFVIKFATYDNAGIIYKYATAADSRRTDYMKFISRFFIIIVIIIFYFVIVKPS